MRKIINSTYISLDGVIENPQDWPSLGAFSDVVSGDLVAEATRLKEQPGQDIVQYGFGVVSHTLVLAAIVLTAPSTPLLFFLPLSVTIGYNLYIGVSLLVQAAIRYGGCEILGIPTLVLRRRYAVYCVFNATDLVERGFQNRPGWLKWTLALLMFAVTMVLQSIAVTFGDADGERVPYLLFLLVGLVVDKVRSALGAST